MLMKFCSGDLTGRHFVLVLAGSSPAGPSPSSAGQAPSPGPAPWARPLRGSRHRFWALPPPLQSPERFSRLLVQQTLAALRVPLGRSGGLCPPQSHSAGQAQSCCEAAALLVVVALQTWPGAREIQQQPSPVTWPCCFDSLCPGQSLRHGVCSSQEGEQEWAGWALKAGVHPSSPWGTTRAGLTPAVFPEPISCVEVPSFGLSVTNPAVQLVLAQRVPRVAAARQGGDQAQSAPVLAHSSSQFCSLQFCSAAATLPAQVFSINLCRTDFISQADSG